MDLIITGGRNAYSVAVVEVKDIKDHLFGRVESKVRCRFEALTIECLKALKRHYHRRRELI